MGTPANTRVDVVFEAVPDRRAFTTAMNALRWLPWLRPADVADPDDNREVGFDKPRIVSRWTGNQCYMRVETVWWDKFTPPASMNILHQLDPFAPLVFADPEAPTEAELNANDVFWHIAQDDAKVATIRKVRPRDVDDGTGKLVKQGLRLGAFDEGRVDHKGKNELAAVVI